MDSHTGSKKIRVCHLTSVHRPDDVRIFHKECVSLAAAGYDVTLVAPAEKDYEAKGVKIRAVETGGGRIKRMTKRTWQVYKAGLKSGAELFHFHDPELLPVGYLLKLKGKKVIFDAHEDLPRQILTKHWIPKKLRGIVAGVTENFENQIVKKLDAVVCATPFIRDRFLNITQGAVDINNYPIISSDHYNTLKKELAVCYVGGIHENRGIKTLVEAAGLAKTELRLAGNYSPIGFRETLQQMEGWKYVKEYGFVKPEKVREIIGSSIAGMVTLPPWPSYKDSLPVKMFEYMAAGVAVIASDFPLWRQIVSDADCGVLVDPENPALIADAIKLITQNPQEAERLGANGRKAVLEKYNWSIEEKKLIELYSRLVS